MLPLRQTGKAAFRLAVKAIFSWKTCSQRTKQQNNSFVRKQPFLKDVLSLHSNKSKWFLQHQPEGSLMHLQHKAIAARKAFFKSNLFQSVPRNHATTARRGFFKSNIRAMTSACMYGAWESYKVLCLGKFLRLLSHRFFLPKSGPGQLYLEKNAEQKKRPISSSVNVIISMRM